MMDESEIELCEKDEELNEIRLRLIKNIGKFQEEMEELKKQINIE